MTQKRLTQFDDDYAFAIREIMDAPLEKDGRTSRVYRAVPGMYFRAKGLPLLTLRDINPLWAFAEAVWFMSGSGDPEFMRFFGFSAWDKFAVRGLCQSALGYRWGKSDQIGLLVKRLAADPTAKSGCLDAWRPREDLTSKRDKPCVPFWHLTIVNDALHLTILQRSADMWFGFPHDIAGASIIQGLIASELNVKAGAIAWTIGNAHLYEDQIAPAERLLREDETRFPGATPNFHFWPPSGAYDRARSGDRLLPWDMWRQVQEEYDKLKGPKIKGPRLVV